MGEQEQKIRERAYSLWEQEGRPEGRADEHWAAAVQSLNDEGRFKDFDGAEAPPTAPDEAPTTSPDGDALPSGTPEGPESPVSEIDTIHRTLETPNSRRAGLSPQGDTEGAMSGAKGRRP